jgi:hypothetical protein
MKLCVAGSRSIIGRAGRAHVRLAIAEAFEKWGVTREDVEEAVSGMAPGPDKIWAGLAKRAGVPVKPFPAAWDDLDAPGAVIRRNKHGLFNAKAGHDRNQEMADYATHFVILWDGRSTGTADMTVRVESTEKPFHFYRTDLS